MECDFTGRKVLVTGAAGGIGRAIARVFLDRAACVALVDFRTDELVRVQQELGAPERTVTIPADVRDWERIEAALDAAWQALGGLDTLVNAAGIYPSDPILEMREEDWDRVLDTNLKGPFLIAQRFARRLVEAGLPGYIVNITSGAAQRARPGAAHYCASKAGLEMLTKALALELAPYGIHVNAVSPGFVEVRSEVNPLSENYVQAISQSIPWGRPGQSSDIAQAVAFLCSEGADWITGSSLRVDGGAGAGTTSLPPSREKVDVL